ncbi:hypothetical protein U1Q18_036489 [Sarracenia purpurea var. burkii]
MWKDLRLQGSYVPWVTLERNNRKFRGVKRIGKAVVGKIFQSTRHRLLLTFWVPHLESYVSIWRSGAFQSQFLLAKTGFWV